MKPLLLCFVGCLLYHTVVSFDLTALDGYPPDEKIYMIKKLIKFQDDQIFGRMMAAEARTCKEVNAVLASLRANMETDLSLLMKEVSSHLDQTPPPGDKWTTRCLRDIGEDVQDVIDKGRERFHLCTNAAEYRIKEGNKNSTNKTEYDIAIRYTINGLDECLKFSGRRSKAYMNRCLKMKLNQTEVMFATAYDHFRDSLCMSLYKTEVLSCVIDVYNYVAERKIKIRDEIVRCEGDTDFDVEPEVYGLNINNALSFHGDSFIWQNSNYVEKFNTTYLNILKEQIKQKKFQKEYLATVLADHLRPYYELLNTTRDERRNKKESECYDDAIRSLGNVSTNALRGIVVCETYRMNKLNKAEKTLTKIVSEFNTKLQEDQFSIVTGNVAVLRCFGSRSQDVFNSDAIYNCVRMAWQLMDWAWMKVELELTNLNNSLVPSKILSNGQTCGELWETRWKLEAERTLMNCTRCLYSATGDYYPVTLPYPTTTTEATTVEIETRTYTDSHAETEEPAQLQFQFE